MQRQGNVLIRAYIDGEHHCTIDTAKFQRLGGDECFVEFVPDGKRGPLFRLEFDRSAAMAGAEHASADAASGEGA